MKTQLPIADKETCNLDAKTRDLNLQTQSKTQTQKQIGRDAVFGCRHINKYHKHENMRIECANIEKNRNAKISDTNTISDHRRKNKSHKRAIIQNCH